MIYNYVPVNEVIGKIVSDTGIPEAGYINRIREWIGELLRRICGTLQLERGYIDSVTCLYRTKLPANIMTVYGVGYKGKRLPYRDTGFSPLSLGMDNEQTNHTTVVQVNTDWLANPDLSSYAQAWEELRELDYNNWYCFDAGHIITSVENDVIRIFAGRLPHDKNGMPMIPDSSALHEALYWFCRHKLIGVGWTDPVYQRDDRICYERHKEYYNEARSDMNMSNPDMDLSLADQQNRYFPDVDRWANFDNITPETDML